MTMGIVEVLLGGAGCCPHRDNHVYLETYQLSRERGEAIRFSLCRRPFNDNVFSLDVAKLAQAMPEYRRMRAATAEVVGKSTNPIRGTLPVCCASA